MRHLIDDSIQMLNEGYCFIRIIFDDNSEEVVCTTLNKEIINDSGITFIQDHFYDFLKKRYIPFRYDATDIIVCDENIELKEVHKFANQFI